MSTPTMSSPMMSTATVAATQPASVAPQAAPTVNRPAMQRHLDGRWAETRRRTRALMADPRFAAPADIAIPAYRQWTLDRIAILLREGSVLRAFPTRLGGADNPGENIAGYEELLVGDASVQIKAGVQWGLFAAAIQHLGTPEQHDRLLPGAMSLAVPGSFAMTETGHGSDVSAIETVARYDPHAQAFDLHTPHRAAWKDYLGNAAEHAVAAVVFAQLVTPDGRSHGVHAFYVPIREVTESGGAGAFLPGIGGEDDGAKGGLRGVDNGRLWFDHVAVPRENLLARYGQVDPGGAYSSPIESQGRRFFTMLGSLVQGRVSLDGAAGIATKLALSIAVTYGNQRRQFAAPGTSDEVVLLDYAEHQRRLMPRVAAAYARHFAHAGVLDHFHAVFSGEADTPQEREDLETTAAALKAASTWAALDTIATCRQACGGAGYLSENRLTSLYADLDVYATFEGDNTVLMQLVGKRLLTDYAKDLGRIDAGGIAKLALERATDAVRFSTPLERVAQVARDTGSVRRAASALRDGDLQEQLLAERVGVMTQEIASQLATVRKASPARAAVVVNAQQHSIVELGRAYADLLAWRALDDAIGHAGDPDNAAVLTTVRNLYALSTIERELAWYVLNGRMSVTRAKAVSSSVDRLCAKLRPVAQDLVDSWGYGPEHLRAAIAGGAEQARQDEAMDHRAAAAQEASGLQAAAR